ncbi:MAG: DUF1559 domain-containing protein [Verrucomicrobia bacterium]|nr:DUF1559 domain-containing protein [Verrucomicrobiota bacterium]
MRTPLQSMRDHSFTLVELLVVIAIIGLLAALLAPGLKGARDKARQVQCMNNLRQIGHAMSMYQNDNNGFYPLAMELVSGVYRYRWMWRLRSYVSYRNNLFACPLNPNRPIVAVAFADDMDYPNSNYGYNFRYLSLDYNGGKKPDEIVGYPNLIACTDASSANVSWSIMVWKDPTPDYIYAPGSWHLLGANVLYVDGHVKWSLTSALRGVTAPNWGDGY